MQKGVDFVGIAVVYFCHDGKGNFVMAKRGTQARDNKGAWDIGAGAIELHEKAVEALKKEIKEEYCAEVLDFEFLGYRDVLGTPEQSNTHWVTLDFKVLVDPKQVQLGEPHKFDDLKWFTMDNLPSFTHSELPHFLEKYKDRL